MIFCLVFTHLLVAEQEKISLLNGKKTYIFKNNSSESWGFILPSIHLVRKNNGKIIHLAYAVYGSQPLLKSVEKQGYTEEEVAQTKKILESIHANKPNTLEQIKLNCKVVSTLEADKNSCEKLIKMYAALQKQKNNK